MVAQSTPDMPTLFTLYVQKRQRGQSMDSVVKELQDAAYRLPRDDRHQLGELVTEWEEKYGSQANMSPQITPPSKSEPPPLPAVKQALDIKPPTSAPAFGTRFLDPSKLPGAPVPPPQVRSGEPTIGCSRCGKANPATNAICQFCGNVFQPVTPSTRRLESVGNLTDKANPDDSAYFGPTSTLLLAIRGAKGLLEAYPRDKLIVGRSSPGLTQRINIDLAPFSAEALGVSRIHAQLRVQENTLAIVDLNSDNGTYVNDQRVFPHEVRVLRSGDEIRLGRLVFKIGYKHK